MLQFDLSGKIMGASIKTYLLEKTRVVKHARSISPRRCFTSIPHASPTPRASRGCASAHPRTPQRPTAHACTSSRPRLPAREPAWARALAAALLDTYDSIWCRCSTSHNSYPHPPPCTNAPYRRLAPLLDPVPVRSGIRTGVAAPRRRLDIRHIPAPVFAEHRGEKLPRILSPHPGRTRSVA